MNALKSPGIEYRHAHVTHWHIQEKYALYKDPVSREWTWFHEANPERASSREHVELVNEHLRKQYGDDVKQFHEEEILRFDVMKNDEGLDVLVCTSFSSAQEFTDNFLMKRWSETPLRMMDEFVRETGHESLLLMDVDDEGNEFPGELLVHFGSKKVQE